MISSGKIFELWGVKMFFENDNIYNAETGEKLYHSPYSIDYIVYNNLGYYEFIKYFEVSSLKDVNNINKKEENFNPWETAKINFKFYTTKLTNSKPWKINFIQTSSFSKPKEYTVWDESIKQFSMDDIDKNYVLNTNRANWFIIERNQYIENDYPWKNLWFTSLLQIQNEKKQKEKEEAEKKKEQENLAKKEEKKKEDLKNNKFFNDIETDFLWFEYKKITEDWQTYLLVDNTKFENYVMQKINEFTTFFYITIFFLFVYLNFIIFKKLLWK